MPTTDAHLFVIFGATGDLTRRKLVPALFRVMTANGVAHSLTLLGVGRTELDDVGFRTMVREALGSFLEDRSELAAWCDENVFYQASPQDAPLFDVRKRIEEIEADRRLPGNRVLYLALPPGPLPSTITALGEAGLATSPGWTRLVIEKPFGKDLESARLLNGLVHSHFAESQVYRIDHYLGKETVQNLLAFRFANLLFESSWNRDGVESVEITVAETLGLEGRAGYYDEAGVIRDILQSHLTQLLTLVAMDAPRDFDADSIRDEKVRLLKAIGRIGEKAVVLGQYAAGAIPG